jgi:hypothetical protein
MSSLLDFQLREENEGASLEPQDAVIDQLAMIDAREQAPLDEFDHAWPTRPPARAVARLSETTGEGSTDREISEESGPRDDASFSRDLINAYFRHMGNSPLLSREEEISVAKRIEAGQQAILHHLCQIPMLIESIREWGNELRQGHRRLRDFDFSVLADESLRRGNNDQIVQGVASARHVQGRSGRRVDDMKRGSPGEQAPSLSLVSREVRLMPNVLARISISTQHRDYPAQPNACCYPHVLGHNVAKEDAARVRARHLDQGHCPRSCAHGGEGQTGPAGNSESSIRSRAASLQQENRRPGRGSSSGRRVDIIPWAGADIPGPSDRRGWRYHPAT